MSGITTGEGCFYPDSHVLPTFFGFCAVMAAGVAQRRGGDASSYLRECASFMLDVTPDAVVLPADYDWSVGAAKECAAALLEYDA